MKKLGIVFFIIFTQLTAAQFLQEDSIKIEKDTIIVYQKSIDIAKERVFKERLNEIYNDEAFVYTEDEYEEKKTTTSPFAESFLNIIIFFMSFIFPFLLGGIIIYIILKAALSSETSFWKFNNKSKTSNQKLVYEEEDIHDVDLENILQQAIENEDFRQAIRYYYLIVLKELSTKKLIHYDKDKTNSEYLFELKSTIQKKQFSYLSYIYNYIWYGEFLIDKANFKLAERKYQSFKKSLQ